MKLVDILIAAGVTPDDLHPYCMFIAQDSDGLLATYEQHPVLYELFTGMWDTHFICAGSKIPLRLALSYDWQTPITREDFIAAYNAYHKIETLPSDSEMLDWLMTNNGVYVAEFGEKWIIDDSFDVLYDTPRQAIAAAMAKEAK